MNEERHIFRSIMKGLFYGLFHIIYRFDIEGMENIPQEGGAILCPNHIHAFDSISIVLNTKRLMYIMVKKELMSNFFTNWFFKKLCCFPVDRGRADTEALDIAEEHLNDGYLLLLFPEGSRNALSRGKKLKKGAAIISVQAKKPIIPIGVKGSFIPFTKVKIKIGEPLNLSEYFTKEEITPKDYIAITNKLQEQIVLLRDEC